MTERAAERRGGLGRGLAALIPTGPPPADAPPPPTPRRSVTGTGPDGDPVRCRAGPRVGRRGCATSSLAAQRRLPRDRRRCDRPEPAAAADGLRRGGARRARALHPRVRAPAAHRGPGGRHRSLRARHGRAAVAGRAAGRPRADPGDRPADGRRRLLRDALLENIHRVQLNPLEEAAAYEQLLVEFGVTHDELADRLGRSRPVVTNTIRLLKLPVTVQRRVAAGCALGRARPRPAGPGGRRRGRRTSRPASSPRACRYGRRRRRCSWRGARSPHPRPPRRKPAPDPTTHELAERLSRHVRHASPRRDRPAEGPDRRRVRLDGRPGADRRPDGWRARLTTFSSHGPVFHVEHRPVSRET